MNKTLTTFSLLALLTLSGCGLQPDEPRTPPDPGYEDIPAIITVLPGLADSEVVCPDCEPTLLQAKTAGILAALTDLVEFAGDDVHWDYAPVTFHLQGDETCGPYAAGRTGFWRKDEDGRAHVCLFDLEKTNRSLPFTAENAGQPADQLLPVHEALHVWFANRLPNYAVEEPFCKLTSFIISGALAQTDPDPCAWFNDQMPYPDRLMYDLCGLGLDEAGLSGILRRTATDSRQLGRTLSLPEFVGIVSDTLGTDAAPAFQAAGLLP